ncbi:iron-sulfur cluster insertion protein ErpA [Roseomonas genomospecies 6]|uniref:Iron-sulfur cluster insertion protein ErpA n=1 Tax=Roseomonas genomospecies 6 TaxID=214106 RepID=A0A9W7NFQ7_9PROT|nr:iron-sulfur cluster insertion protein ErpA [Roseomonas genomospecies 6]KAA0676876.1 iron-sulfur cluster insertion protein ErpA [Roseomonas genomospecies 6]
MPDTALPAATQEGARVLTVSDSAARRVAFLIEHEGNPALMLRLTVSGGGCSGFQYGFSFDAAVNEDDHVFEKNGVKVVTDDCSLDLLAGSTLDYVEDLMGAAFQIKNPNATASCGCGNSFAA